MSAQQNLKTNRWTLQAILGWLFLLCFAGYAVGSRYAPVSTGLRLLFLGSVIFGLFNILIFFSRMLKNRRWMLFPAFLFLILAGVLIFLGNKKPDPEHLREAYLRQLQTFEKAPYRKGGESSNGVDASGLARTALWQAMMKQGLQNMNLRLLGPDLWKFWWRDLSTADLLNKKYDYTVHLGDAENLAAFDSVNLKAGDLAVTDPYHVLIYCGDGTWIDANPDAGKVQTGDVSSKGNWSRIPVIFLRWRVLT
jgi:NlpC/P60 family